jgi:sugar fermentation stimulation protein A
MNFEPPLVRGRLIRRYKRFLADVDSANGVLTLHCPNTGAMSGCSEPGLEVWYSASANPRRKYPHTLEVVCTPDGRVGINSARANDLVAEALAGGRIAELRGHSRIRREVAIPTEGTAGSRGRFDFRLEAAAVPCWVEVKSMTLCRAQGRGAFPDAVSDRALRHVEALAARRGRGERAVLLFCVQHTGVRFASPADDVHPAYGTALRAAVRSGVEVLAYRCRIELDGISLTTPVPVKL